MNNTDKLSRAFNWHKKSKLTEQLKFFGAKKQGFISVYAKKPRILVKPEVKGVFRVDEPYKMGKGDVLRRYSAHDLYLDSLVAQHDVNRQFSAMGNQSDLSGLSAQGIMQSQLAANYGIQQAQIAASRGRAMAGMQAAARSRLF